MRILLLGMILPIVGCTTTEYVKEPVDVYVPVPVPCDVEIPPDVRHATDYLSREDSDFDKIKALLVERRERAALEAELRALLKACSQD